MKKYQEIKYALEEKRYVAFKLMSNNEISSEEKLSLENKLLIEINLLKWILDE